MEVGKEDAQNEVFSVLHHFDSGLVKNGHESFCENLIQPISANMVRHKLP